MTSEAVRRVRRLAAFRAKERDRKSIDNIAAQTKRDEAQESLVESRRTLAEEIGLVRSSIGRAMTRETLSLSCSCVESAGSDVGRSARALGVAEKALAETRRKLLEAHYRVRQMDELASMKQAAEDRKERLREQRELDDLAVVSEVNR
jgi:flagellar export protein FliJ